MKFMQKELLINRSNRRIGYDSSRYCRYKQKILAAIFIDEKFRIVRKIVIMKGVYSI